jgi:hypothetical protein
MHLSCSCLRDIFVFLLQVNGSNINALKNSIKWFSNLLEAPHCMFCALEPPRLHSVLYIVTHRVSLYFWRILLQANNALLESQQQRNQLE